MADPAQPFSAPRRERLRYMEATLIWEGAFQRSQVAGVFGVHENSVTDDLTAYQDRYADHLKYDNRQKRYLRGDKFTPKFASDDPNEYLALLLAYAETRSSAVAPLLAGAGNVAVAVPSPAPVLDREVLKLTLQAIRKHQGFRATYHSTRAPQPETCELWPHALFYTGIRWFVRAYNRKTGKFRSYAIQRLERPKALHEAPVVSLESDNDWSQHVDIEVMPNPALDEHGKMIVAREFAMKEAEGGYVWNVRVRKCLVWFFLNRYRLDEEEPDKRRNRVVLKNRQSLPHILDSGV